MSLISTMAGLAVYATGLIAGAETRPAAGGVILGTIEPAKPVQGVLAIDRETRQARTGQWDSARARFRIEGLTPSHRYDLRILTRLGTVEGVDLGPREPLRATRSAAAEPLREQDKQQIRRLIRSVERFEDQVRVLFLRGTGEHVTALVEKLRTRPFHGMRGEEVIWRIEVWYFTWQYGGWQREANVEKVLIRRRMLRRDFENITWVFDPDLGGIVAAPPAIAKPLKIRLGPQFDKRFGQLSHTFEAKLLSPASRPASQPAR